MTQATLHSRITLKPILHLFFKRVSKSKQIQPTKRDVRKILIKLFIIFGEQIDKFIIDYQKKSFGWMFFISCISVYSSEDNDIYFLMNSTREISFRNCSTRLMLNLIWHFFCLNFSIFGVLEFHLVFFL